MRRKATATNFSDRGAKGNINIKAKENGANVNHLKVAKHTGRPTKTPSGKGLGKAGAKRLGQLLKRAIHVEEPAAKEARSLPKTPVRLFKHQIQTEDNAQKTNAAQTKPASHHISQLILRMVAHCKHRGGISMSELKQTLAAGGYSVTKNNTRVNVVTKRLVHNETAVRTTRSATFRLNNKKVKGSTHVRMRTVKSPNPKGEMKQSKPTSKSTKAANKSHKALKTTKTKGKLHKPKGRARPQAAKTQKPRDKTRKPAGKSQKLTNKTRKPAGKSQKQRRKTPKPRTKSSKPGGKKPRYVRQRSAQVRKTSRKSQRTWRRQPKQNQHLNKSLQKRLPPRGRLSKTKSRLKMQQRQINRRRSYYY